MELGTVLLAEAWDSGGGYIQIKVSISLTRLNREGISVNTTVMNEVNAQTPDVMGVACLRDHCTRNKLLRSKF